MVSARSLAIGWGALALILLPAVSVAQWGPPMPLMVARPPSFTTTTPPSDLAPSVGLKKFVNSFTSYEFPNPFDAAQDPLSRLEFPFDQWFVGVRSGYAAQLWELEGQAWINATRESGLRMQDSDWDDETIPFQKTVFSESRCRLNRGILLDFSLGLPVLGLVPNITPVMGYRFQQFHFMTHDGFQEVFGGPGMDLPGDGIDFRQTFHHVFFGGKMRVESLTGGRSRAGGFAGIEVQVDYARVSARNEDRHLLRDGNRITIDTTRGHCWHVFAAAGFLLRADVLARVEFDFKRTLTTGSHRLLNDTFGIDFSFDGARVWSDQASLFAALSVAL